MLLLGQQVVRIITILNSMCSISRIRELWGLQVPDIYTRRLRSVGCPRVNWFSRAFEFGFGHLLFTVVLNTSQGLHCRLEAILAGGPLATHM